MKQPAINEQLVRRYLLGDLPRRERERVEAGLLTDDHYYQSLTALEEEVEDDLIDEYLHGELTESERENFNRVFLTSPERLHKFKVLKDLKEHAGTVAHGEVSDPKTIDSNTSYGWIPAIALFQNPLFGLSSAAALTLVLLCCVWLWIRSNSLEAQLRQAKVQHPTDSSLKDHVEQLTRQNEELLARLKLSEDQRAGLEQDIDALRSRETPQVTPQNQPSTPARSTFATVILSPVTRSGSGDGPSTLTFQPGHTEGRLTLNVYRINPTDYKRFRVVVKEQAGPEVWRNEDLKLQSVGKNARAVLIIPAEKLAASQYVGELDAITSDEQSEALGSYVFRVVHK